jgi:hypothetical protein
VSFIFMSPLPLILNTFSPSLYTVISISILSVDLRAKTDNLVF